MLDYWIYSETLQKVLYQDWGVEYDPASAPPPKDQINVQLHIQRKCSDRDPAPTEEDILERKELAEKIGSPLLFEFWKYLESEALVAKAVASTPREMPITTEDQIKCAAIREYQRQLRGVVLALVFAEKRKLDKKD